MQTGPQPEILVVDDEAVVFEILTRVGRQFFPEAQFVLKSSPQEAIHYLDDRSKPQPHLVLLDIDFHQETDGFSLLSQLRHQFRGHIPIIMLSNLKGEPEIQQAYDTGAVAFTHKPESLEGWKAYVEMLKQYWFKTISLPSGT
ncbi:response regulator [Larkinella ripae]